MRKPLRDIQLFYRKKGPIHLCKIVTRIIQRKSADDAPDRRGRDFGVFDGRSQSKSQRERERHEKNQNQKQTETGLSCGRRDIRPQRRGPVKRVSPRPAPIPPLAAGGPRPFPMGPRGPRRPSDGPLVSRSRAALVFFSSTFSRTSPRNMMGCRRERGEP